MKEDRISEPLDFESLYKGAMNIRLAYSRRDLQQGQHKAITFHVRLISISTGQTLIEGQGSYSTLEETLAPAPFPASIAFQRAFMNAVYLLEFGSELYPEPPPPDLLFTQPELLEPPPEAEQKAPNNPPVEKPEKPVRDFQLKTLQNLYTSCLDEEIYSGNGDAVDCRKRFSEVTDKPRITELSRPEADELAKYLRMILKIKQLSLSRYDTKEEFESDLQENFKASRIAELSLSKAIQCVDLLASLKEIK